MKTATAHFLIKKSAENGRWYWTLEAKNGEPILRTSQSNGYLIIDEATDAIHLTREAVKQHKGGKQTIERFIGDVKSNQGDKLYFRIVHEDGDNLAVSEGYRSNGARAKGIDSVIDNAPIADITIIS